MSSINPQVLQPFSPSLSPTLRFPHLFFFKCILSFQFSLKRWRPCWLWRQ